MKLSEAILLGSVMHPLRKGDWNRCILGCAANAVGVPEVIPISNSIKRSIERRIDAIKAHWPWLNRETQLYTITYYFDQQKMTFTEIVDYIKRVEPPCGECNDFDCCCERAADVLAALQGTVSV